MKPLRFLVHATVAIVLAGLLGVGMAWSQSSEGPSLADLARQKKKKDDKKSKHVYSDENLPKAGADFGGTSTVGGSGAPASGSGASGAPAAEGATAAAPGAGGEAKAGEPSPDLAAATEKLEAAKKDEEMVKGNIKKLEDQMASETSEFRRETYRQALENSQASLADFARKREEAEKEAAAAEAAGRKKKKPAATQPSPE